VSFLERLFSRTKMSPAAAYTAGRGNSTRSQVPAEYHPFITELMAIGTGEGFLSFKPGGRYNQQCRHIRAREIGMRLNMAGGSSLMRKVYERVDCANVRQLAAAWGEIGDWAG